MCSQEVIAKAYTTLVRPNLAYFISHTCQPARTHARTHARMHAMAVPLLSVEPDLGFFEMCNTVVVDLCAFCAVFG